MRCFFLITFFAVACSVAFGQTKPRNFPEKTTASDNDAIYTQESGGDKKILFATAKKYFAPNANTIPIAYVPTPTGNALNRTEFVKDSLDRIWFIDGAGDGFLLEAGAPTTQTFTNLTTGNTVTLAGSAPTDVAQIEVYRNGIKQRLGAGLEASISWPTVTFNARAFSFSETVEVVIPRI